jgi:hypothetical protein
LDHFTEKTTNQLTVSRKQPVRLKNANNAGDEAHRKIVLARISRKRFEKRAGLRKKHTLSQDVLCLLIRSSGALNTTRTSGKRGSIAALRCTSGGGHSLLRQKRMGRIKQKDRCKGGQYRDPKAQQGPGV